MYPPYYGATYASLSLSESSPPQSFAEPLAFEEVAAYLKLNSADFGDPGVTSELEGFIQAAREQAEIFQGRDLVRKQYDMVLDYWPWEPIRLRPHLASVDLMQYKQSDGTVVEMAEGPDYIVDTSKQPGIAMPPYNQQWPAITPWPTSALLVRFTCGLTPLSVFWADTGARVKIGMKMLISEWFHNRLPCVTGPDAAYGYHPAIIACLSHGSALTVR